MASKWFSVKTFYRFEAKGSPYKPDLYYDPDSTLVEERILILKAKNKSEALKKAEKEAKEYARSVVYQNVYQQNVEGSFIELKEIYELPDNLMDKTEVFCTTRLMSHKISNKKIGHLYLSHQERDLKKSKRKKFINQDLMY